MWFKLYLISRHEPRSQWIITTSLQVSVHPRRGDLECEQPVPTPSSCPAGGLLEQEMKEQGWRSHLSADRHSAPSWRDRHLNGQMQLATRQFVPTYSRANIVRICLPRIPVVASTSARASPLERNPQHRCGARRLSDLVASKWPPVGRRPLASLGPPSRGLGHDGGAHYRGGGPLRLQNAQLPLT